MSNGIFLAEFKVCWENIQSVEYSEGDEDDTEEASVNYVGESRAYADTDGGKEVATRTRKKKPNAKTQFNGRAKTRRYTCEECPYDTTNLLRFETHRTFHEEGSGAVPCEDCGWYLMPKSMGRHRAHAHPTGRPKVVDKIRGAGVSQVRLCYLQCPECQALIARLEDYREHERLHESGAGETCAECGWLCKRMSSHHARWHPNETSFVRHKYPRYIKRMPSRLHHPNQTPPIQKKYAK
ncbi:unnamed protein product [Orchesella dallaii]|uniref:C2H2-type domain-containing protein n=1 Tax=Orchesella dallaii TaxID=48710 RepID=A0ABP1R5I0_9HEXA